jgi:hypothetical protein
MKRLAIVGWLLAVFMSDAAPRLKVSDNKRFLVTEDGSPFFYLGDTAWELFHRLNREEADRYLDDRARKGFTVIQAVALAELDGLNDPNAYGHKPLINNDPAKPDVKDGEDYWDHVDYVVHKAESLGMFVGFLPTWGDKWHSKPGQGSPVFNERNAEGYGEWLGKRYKEKAIIWILGGDRPIESDEHKKVLRAMARGLRRRRRLALDHVSSARRQWLVAMVPRGGLAGFQHEAERACAGVHWPLRQDAGGLRSPARQAGARW